MRLAASKKTWFTLAEILILIVVIIAFVSSVIPIYLNSREKWRDVQRMKDLHELTNVVEFYYKDKEQYPPLSIHGCIDDATLAPFSSGHIFHDPLPDHQNGCNQWGRYAYGMSHGIQTDQHFFILMAFMERPFVGNYGWDIAGFTGDVSKLSHERAVTWIRNGKWRYYIQVK